MPVTAGRFCVLCGHDIFQGLHPVNRHPPPNADNPFLERIMLDTQAQALLQLMVERKVPAVNTLPPEKAREFSEKDFLSQAQSEL